MGMHSMRWLVLVIFGVGYVGTRFLMREYWFQYGMLTGLGALGCGVLLSALSRPLRIIAPVWVLLTLFLVGYYLQFYWLVYSAGSIGEGWHGLGWMAQSPSVLIDTYSTITYTFCAFCGVGWLIGVHAGDVYVPRVPEKIDDRGVTWFIMWVSPILMATTGVLMRTTGIAVMGAEPVYLPYRLAGVIFYTRLTVIPALLLVLIWCSDRANLAYRTRIGYLLLFLHGFMEIALRASKGVLFLMFLLVAFLFIVTDRMTWRRVCWIGAVGILMLAMWPLVSAYRIVRIDEPSSGIYEVAARSEQLMRQGGISVSQGLEDAVGGMFLRVTGAEQLLHIVGSGIEPLGMSWLFDPRVEEVHRVEVSGYPPEVVQGLAPGLIGWLYLVGGRMFAVGAVMLYIGATWLCWWILARMRLYCLPVAQAVFLLLLFGISMEGALSAVFRGIIVAMGAILACELVIRNGLRPHWLRK
jgi:hypothetical protein